MLSINHKTVYFLQKKKMVSERTARIVYVKIQAWFLVVCLFLFVTPQKKTKQTNKQTKQNKTKQNKNTSPRFISRRVAYFELKMQLGQNVTHDFIWARVAYSFRLGLNLLKFLCSPTTDLKGTQY